MQIQLSVTRIAIACAIALGFAAVCAAQPTSAVQPLRFASFGVQTLDAGRTARLSVIHNALPGNPAAGAPVSYAAKAYFDVYSIRASDGALRFLRRVTREAILLPGEGFSFDFVGPATTIGDGSVRVASTVYVKRMTESSLLDEAAPVSVSLEIRDRSGSLLLLPGTLRGFNPQPDPPHEIGGLLF